MDDSTGLVQGQKAQALIIGAGIAGLLAARVLSDYYDQVLVIERDTLPERSENRPGTPQGYQIHRLLGRGKLILQKLFPGFIDTLLENGAYPLEDKKTLLFMQDESVALSYPGKDASCSRALLEWVLRQRVQALPGVHFLTNREVLGLEMTPDRSSVTGIQLRQRGQLAEQTTLTADLVVDASGRSSKLTQWLQALGYAIPESEQVDTAIGYSTRYYRALPDAPDNWAGIMKPSYRSKTGSAGAVIRIEDNIWMSLLINQGGHYPPTAIDLFEQQLKDFIGPRIFDILQHVEPLADPRGYRIPVCIRQHFEQMEEWPAGLLVMGDAFCSMDPIYGQGMTVAAIEAETLEFCLREQQGHPQPAFERRVLQRIQEAIHPAWWLSSIADLRIPGVRHTGPYPLQGVSIIHRYLDLFLKYTLRYDKERLENGQIAQTYYFKYAMMNGLISSPREVFNSNILATLLVSEDASEEQQLLAELFQSYPKYFNEMMDEAIPNFSLAFNRHPVNTPVAEIPAR